MPNQTCSDLLTLNRTFPEKPQKLPDNQKYLYISRQTLKRLEQTCELPSVDMKNYVETVGNGTFQIPVKNVLNSTKEAYIYNGDSGDMWLKDKDQKLKLGKIIKQLWAELDSTQIETAVTKWKGLYTVDTSVVKVSDDIGGIYDLSSVGGSCMYGHGDWMAIYEELGCKVAYLLDDNERIRARAILWDNNVYQENDTDNVVTILDRVFFEKENDKITLERWAKEKGYISSFNGVDTRTCKSVGDGFDGVPYVDTMYSVIKSEVGGQYQLSNGCGNEYDTLQSTEGNSENNCGISDFNNEDYVWCEDYEEDRHIDDTYYNNTHECYYASEEDLVCMNGDYYHCEDDRLVHTEDEGWCWQDDCTLAYDNDCWYASTNLLVHCTDIDDYVTNEGAALIEDTGEWCYETDNLYEDNNGCCWSDEDAYIEANGEDDE